MVHRVEVRARRQFGDPHAASVLSQIHELGLPGVTAVRSARLFFLYGKLDAQQACRVADELLIDPVVEQFDLPTPPQEAEHREIPAGQTAASDANVETGAAANGQLVAPPAVQADGSAAAQTPAAATAQTGSVIEIHLKPGVMDPVAASTEQAIGDMGLNITGVRTGRRYELEGDLTPVQVETIARKLLANAVIEDVFFAAHTPPEVQGHSYQLHVTEVPIRELDEAGLVRLSKDGDLFLNVTEMKAIQDYFRKLGREPRDIELEMIAQTWSEHCVHKTFRSDVRVKDLAGNVVREYTNLIKSTVFAATRELDKPWCLSVFEDNAGVIEFDDEHAVCFKVETHNHPSAIEPYGGASTGIGGVIRDPMGTGLGAKPVANTDIFCFGMPDMASDAVPKGVLHPRRVMRGVVGGVRDYGNRMGIPTVNGAVYFDDKYLGNPLVFCGTLGLLPRDKCRKRRPNQGDVILVVGGRTGRDGIHGATFSSGELTHEHETEFSHAVQIGNAITEKKMLDTILQARDEGLYTAITDCGAGGLSSAVGEMGEQIGAAVQLDQVPLKYAGLSYSEIWISEAQERMVLAVPPANLERILKIFRSEGVEATPIGTFGATGESSGGAKLRLSYGQTVVGELDAEFLAEGLPRPTKEAVYEKVPQPTHLPAPATSLGDTLLKVLAQPNVASKEWIIRQYDHEVQGGSAIKPLVGVKEDGPGDAAVVRPVLGSRKGVVIACGMNPRLGELDPYQSALHAVDEAMRNTVAVGGRLDRTAILDNFCWGNCNKPDRMGSFVQASQACYDAAMAYSVPFVSGKDSLNNEFVTEDGQTIAIPPTLLISAISVIDDVGRCVTSDAKAAGNYLFILGRTSGDMGGSHYLLASGLPSGNDVPVVDLGTNLRVMGALEHAIAAGAVRSCHDLSEGGLAVAAAEMAFAGGLGVDVNVAALPTGAAGASPVGGASVTVGGASGAVGDVAALFNESAGRFLVEVAADRYDAFMRLVKDCPFGELGRVTDTGRIVLRRNGTILTDVSLADAKAAWQGTFGGL